MVDAVDPVLAWAAGARAQAAKQTAVFGRFAQYADFAGKILYDVQHSADFSFAADAGANLEQALQDPILYFCLRQYALMSTHNGSAEILVCEDVDFQPAPNKALSLHVIAALENALMSGAVALLDGTNASMGTTAADVVQGYALLQALRREAEDTQAARSGVVGALCAVGPSLCPVSFCVATAARHILATIVVPAFNSSAAGKRCAALMKGRDAHKVACTPLGHSDFAWLGRVGRGGYGSVFAVCRLASGRLYAAKVLDKRRVKKKKAVRLSQLERQSMASVSCPFVSSLSFSYHTEREAVLVTELSTGRDLEWHIRDMRRTNAARDAYVQEQRKKAGIEPVAANPRHSTLVPSRGLPEPLARKVLAEIALGIAHMHAGGMTHRDIKPSNILVDADGRIIVSDLGLTAFVSNPRLRAESAIVAETFQYLKSQVAAAQQVGNGNAVSAKEKEIDRVVLKGLFDCVGRWEPSIPDGPNTACIVPASWYDDLDVPVRKPELRLPLLPGPSRVPGLLPAVAAATTVAELRKMVPGSDVNHLSYMVKSYVRGKAGTPGFWAPESLLREEIQGQSMPNGSTSSAEKGAGLKTDGDGAAAPTATISGEPPANGADAVASPTKKPETKQGAYDGCADWWSYGCLMYAVLTGRGPFNVYGGDTNDDNAAVLGDPSSLYSTVQYDDRVFSPAAEDLCKRLLQRDPRKRAGCGVIGVAEILSHPFFSGLDIKALSRGNHHSSEQDSDPRLQRAFLVPNTHLTGPVDPTREDTPDLDNIVLTEEDQASYSSFQYAAKSAVDREIIESEVLRIAGLKQQAEALMGLTGCCATFEDEVKHAARPTIAAVQMQPPTLSIQTSGQSRRSDGLVGKDKAFATHGGQGDDDASLYGLPPHPLLSPSFIARVVPQQPAPSIREQDNKRYWAGALPHLYDPGAMAAQCKAARVACEMSVISLLSSAWKETQELHGRKIMEQLIPPVRRLVEKAEDLRVGNLLLRSPSSARSRMSSASSSNSSSPTARGTGTALLQQLIALAEGQAVPLTPHVRAPLSSRDEDRTDTGCLSTGMAALTLSDEEVTDSEGRRSGGNSDVDGAFALGIGTTRACTSPDAASHMRAGLAASGAHASGGLSDAGTSWLSARRARAPTENAGLSRTQLGTTGTLHPDFVGVLDDAESTGERKT